MMARPKHPREARAMMMSTIHCQRYILSSLPGFGELAEVEEFESLYVGVFVQILPDDLDNPKGCENPDSDDNEAKGQDELSADLHAFLLFG
jgi:hypothetical protein